MHRNIGQMGGTSLARQDEVRAESLCGFSSCVLHEPHRTKKRDTP